MDKLIISKKTVTAMIVTIVILAMLLVVSCTINGTGYDKLYEEYKVLDGNYSELMMKYSEQSNFVNNGGIVVDGTKYYYDKSYFQYGGLGGSDTSKGRIISIIE